MSPASSLSFLEKTILLVRLRRLTYPSPSFLFSFVPLTFFFSFLCSFLICIGKKEKKSLIIRKCNYSLLFLYEIYFLLYLSLVYNAVWCCLLLLLSSPSLSVLSLILTFKSSSLEYFFFFGISSLWSCFLSLDGLSKFRKKCYYYLGFFFKFIPTFNSWVGVAMNNHLTLILLQYWLYSRSWAKGRVRWLTCDFHMNMKEGGTQF